MIEVFSWLLHRRSPTGNKGVRIAFEELGQFGDGACGVAHMFESASQFRLERRIRGNHRGQALDGNTNIGERVVHLGECVGDASREWIYATIDLPGQRAEVIERAVQ